MSTFDNVVDMAKDLAGTAGKKAEKVVELSKLKLRVSQINSEVKKAYEKLGSGVYHMKKTGYEDEGLIDSVVEEIDTLAAERTRVEEKIAKLKEQVVCETCGAKNKKEAVYCIMCGSRIQDAEE